MKDYRDTKFVVLGAGHIGKYMRVCYADMIDGPLEGKVIICKARPEGAGELSREFGCEVVAGNTLGALRKIMPDIILVCPPPSQIPALLRGEILSYCDECRKGGGILPDIYTFGPTPKVDTYYEILGEDVNTVKILPNMFYATGDLKTAELEANYITFSDGRKWPEEKRERLYRFLSPLINTYEISEKDSVSFLGVRNAAHCFFDMCFLISDMLSARGLKGDHQNVAQVMRAALRQEWGDMPRAIVPCAMDALGPREAEFAGKSAIHWVKGLSDFCVADKLPGYTGDLVRTKRAEAYLVSICYFSREELNSLTCRHATKGGVCEKSGIYFREQCETPMKEAFERHLENPVNDGWWKVWRRKGYEAAEAVARHGLTLSG
jgi:pyrroline-5-carboxylate reductase